MNRSRLPPLNPLRAFEAAARHLSVKAAAEELSVTPGAVSQMIRTLETHLGVQLFERVNRGILLTAAGRDTAGAQRVPADRRCVSARVGCGRQRRADGERHAVLRIRVARPAPRGVPGGLPGRRPAGRHEPHWRISRATASTSRSVMRLGRYIGLCSERLLTVEIVALASPELVARLGMPATPASSSAGRSCTTPSARAGTSGSARSGSTISARRAARVRRLRPVAAGDRRR